MYSAGSCRVTAASAALAGVWNSSEASGTTNQLRLPVSVARSLLCSASGPANCVHSAYPSRSRNTTAATASPGSASRARRGTSLGRLSASATTRIRLATAV